MATEHSHTWAPEWRVAPGEILGEALQERGLTQSVQLSLRHKSDDQFWFTVFHECGHLVSSSRRRDFVDAPTDIWAESASGEELRADDFARDTLIPSSAYERFINQADFGPQAVRPIAKDLDIAPGIVVGRLQSDGHVGPRNLNYLKQRYAWPTDLDPSGSR